MNVALDSQVEDTLAQQYLQCLELLTVKCDLLIRKLEAYIRRLKTAKGVTEADLEEEEDALVAASGAGEDEQKKKDKKKKKNKKDDKVAPVTADANANASAKLLSPLARRNSLRDPRGLQLSSLLQGGAGGGSGHKAALSSASTTLAEAGINLKELMLGVFQKYREESVIQFISRQTTRQLAFSCCCFNVFMFSFSCLFLPFVRFFCMLCR